MINNNFTTDQQQKLKDIGANLNRIRVAKNISLETISHNTHISKRSLAAIEEGNVEKLPEPIYVRGLLSKFAREIEATEIDLDFQASSDSQNRSSNSIPHTNTDKRSFNFQLRSPHLYLLYILLVVISVKAIATFIERPVIVNQTSPPNPASEVEPSESTVEAERSEAAPQLISQSSNSEAVTVGINLQERCWLKVMVDGKVAFEGTLAKGTQRQWTGKREVTIKAGNAGGVVISFNNQQQQILGELGEVEEITYTVN